MSMLHVHTVYRRGIHHMSHFVWYFDVHMLVYPWLERSNYYLHLQLINYCNCGVGGLGNLSYIVWPIIC